MSCESNDFGRGCLPSKYTESLCREIYGLSEYSNRDFDAKTKDGQKV